MTPVLCFRRFAVIVGFLGTAAVFGCGGSSGPASKPAGAAPATNPNADPPTKAAAADPMASQLAESAAKLKQIGLAMFQYHDVYGRLPGASLTGKDGKPRQLSWRVTLLEFLGEKVLFSQFRQDEPWDSEHNKALIAKMPAVYVPVGGAAKPGETYYQVFVGPGTPFESGGGISLPSIADGTATTAEVVEAGTPVVWTRPADLAFNPMRELPKFGGMSADEFNVLMCDGVVHRFINPPDPVEFKKVVTRGGEEIIDFTKLQRKPSFTRGGSLPKL